MSEITLPASLIKRLEQFPNEDIIQLCIDDIIEYQASQNVSESTKKNILSPEFKAKLASRLMVKSLEQTMVEHPEFFTDELLSTIDSQPTTSKFIETIATLRKNNTHFSREFSLTIFQNYLLLRQAVEQKM